MINLIKSAEVYGSEAIVYTGSNAPPDLYIDLIVNNKLEPGMGSGSMYGKGVYTTYNLSGTATESGIYGAFIYKLKVNLYGFISFNPDITKKIYGEGLTPSQQYEKIYGRKDHIFKELIALESAERFSPFSSDLAEPASHFLRGIVKGLIFTGRNDGDVAVIYDPLTIVPIAWKKAEDSSWSSFDKDQIKPAIGRGIAGSFEKSKYEEVDVSKDRVAKKSIDILSNFHGDNLGKKEIASINYLIDNAPITFLSNYSEKDWAKDYLKTAIDRSLFIISPEEFLKQFKDKPWLESNSENVAKSCSKREPYFFLYNFSNQPWAQPYLPTAAEKLAKEDPYYFLFGFANEPWAKEYIPTTAKSCAEKEPYKFLSDFIDKPWAEPYIGIAAKSYAEKDPYYALKDFIDKPWAEPYIGIAVKSCAEKAPFNFLKEFASKPWAQDHIPTAAKACAESRSEYFLGTFANESWAQPYIPIAAENYAEMSPKYFLMNFVNEPWAKEYIPTTAKSCAEKNPDNFIYEFSDKPWAKPYILLAGKSIVERDPYYFLHYLINAYWAKEPIEDLGGKSLIQYAEEILQKKSSYSPRLTKLAKILRSIGLSKEAASILNLK